MGLDSAWAGLIGALGGSLATGGLALAAERLRHRQEGEAWARSERARVFVTSLEASRRFRDAAMNVHSTEPGHGVPGFRVATGELNAALEQGLRLFASDEVVDRFIELNSTGRAIYEWMVTIDVGTLASEEGQGQLRAFVDVWRADRGELIGAMRRELGLARHH
jgi:hypothetical protein